MRGFNLSVPVAFVHKEVVTLKTCLIILTHSTILTYSRYLLKIPFFDAFDPLCLHVANVLLGCNLSELKCKKMH